MNWAIKSSKSINDQNSAYFMKGYDKGFYDISKGFTWCVWFAFMAF